VGQVAGSYDTTAGTQHAFSTGPDGVGITDLNSLVKVPDRVILTRATGINNMGQVVAEVSLAVFPSHRPMP
jgi:hypothetical protein